MKKFLSLVSIGLILNNIFILSVFANVEIELDKYEITVNDEATVDGDVEAAPGDGIKLRILSRNR
jgi:hypothetical protein